MSARRVAIVGGGVSGLAIAEGILRRAEAAGQPVEVTVLEAEAVPGGKIRSAREDGFVVETGPHGFLDKEPAMFALIDRLGLGQAMLRADDAAAKRYIVRAGRLRMVPMKPPQFITSDILPLLGKLRVAMEPFAKGRPAAEETVWQFAARRIGRQAADVLVDAMVTGIYGGDPKALSLKSAFPRMFELEDRYGGLFKAQLAIAREKKALGPGPGGAIQPAKSTSAPGQPTGTLHSFQEGLGQLTSALADRVNVRCNFAAQSLDKAAAFDLYRVRGEGDAVEADAVVLTPPAFVSAQLLGPHVPEVAKAFEAVPYADIAVVVQGYRAEDVGGRLDGFGFLVPHGEGRRILGSIYASSVFPAHVPEGMIMFRTLLGGSRNAPAASGTDAELLTAAKAELSALGCVPETATPVLQRVIRWPKGIPQYTLGHADRVAAADAVESTVPGVFVAGNAFRGVAMLACVADADKVAERVVRYVLAKA